MIIKMEAADHMCGVLHPHEQSKQNQSLAADLQQQNDMSLALMGQILSIRRLLIDAGVSADIMAKADEIIGPEILSNGSSRA